MKLSENIYLVWINIQQLLKIFYMVLDVAGNSVFSDWLFEFKKKFEATFVGTGEEWSKRR